MVDCALALVEVVVFQRFLLLVGVSELLVVFRIWILARVGFDGYEWKAFVRRYCISWLTLAPSDWLNKVLFQFVLGYLCI